MVKLERANLWKACGTAHQWENQKEALFFCKFDFFELSYQGYTMGASHSQPQRVPRKEQSEKLRFLLKPRASLKVRGFRSKGFHGYY